MAMVAGPQPPPPHPRRGRFHCPMGRLREIAAVSRVLRGCGWLSAEKLVPDTCQVWGWNIYDYPLPHHTLGGASGSEVTEAWALGATALGPCRTKSLRGACRTRAPISVAQPDPAALAATRDGITGHSTVTYGTRGLHPGSPNGWTCPVGVSALEGELDQKTGVFRPATPARHVTSRWPLMATSRPQGHPIHWRHTRQLAWARLGRRHLPSVVWRGH